jgi:hypothetical protein
MPTGTLTTTNVDMGPGYLYVAAIGTTEPTDCSTTLPSAWYTVGYTESGSAFSTEITTEDIEVAEELDPIDVRETKSVVTVEFEAAEMTRRNLALALNAGAGGLNDASSLSPPALGTSVYVMLAWDSMLTPTAVNIRRLFRRCKNTSNIQVQNRKAPQKSLIPMTFRCVKPTGLTSFTVFPNSSGLIA